MSDYFEVRDRLRHAYRLPLKETAKAATYEVRGEALGEKGFLTEMAGRVLLTAPASQFNGDTELPRELASRWQEMASSNSTVLWLQGRFVEAEKANRNGSFWSTDDLQFGEMTVKHGPLNWLHQEQTVVGAIADNALVHPAAVQASKAWHDQWVAKGGVKYNAAKDQYTVNSEALHGLLATNTANTTRAGLGDPMPRPYIAAASAMWRWVHPDKIKVVEKAADEGKLFYSMECIAREIQCASDETHTGCGKSFDYMQTMTQPETTCEHIANRTSARRLVDPSFLGGAVIVPPVQPGWGSANVEILKQAASLAEQVDFNDDMKDSEWESLMAQVVKYATS